MMSQFTIFVKIFLLVCTERQRNFEDLILVETQEICSSVSDLLKEKFLL